MSQPVEVSRDSCFKSTFHYTLRHKETSKIYILGVGWTETPTSAGQLFATERELYNHLVWTVGREPTIKLLAQGEIVQVRQTYFVNDTKPVDSKFLREMKKEQFAQEVQAQGPDLVPVYYMSFHDRPKKAIYKFAMHYDSNKMKSWLKSNWKTVKPFMPSYLSGPSDLNYYWIGDLMKPLLKDAGLPYPQVKVNNSTILFRSKADAMMFKLKYSIPHKFYDFAEIRKDFDTTGKVTIKAI